MRDLCLRGPFGRPSSRAEIMPCSIPVTVPNGYVSVSFMLQSIFGGLHIQPTVTGTQPQSALARIVEYCNMLQERCGR